MFTAEDRERLVRVEERVGSIKESLQARPCTAHDTRLDGLEAKAQTATAVGKLSLVLLGFIIPALVGTYCSIGGNHAQVARRALVANSVRSDAGLVDHQRSDSALRRGQPKTKAGPAVRH